MTTELVRRLDEMKEQAHETMNEYMNNDDRTAVEFIQAAGAATLHTAVDVLREDKGDNLSRLGPLVAECFPANWKNDADWVDNTDWEIDGSVLGVSMRHALSKVKTADDWTEEQNGLFQSAFVNGFTTAANDVVQACADEVSPRVHDGQHRMGLR